ncbi:hypothetical protein A2U01_0083204, partial [Trifolium medium]|nr:hypothetical protein [Trifolium medium]
VSPVLTGSGRFWRFIPRFSGLAVQQGCPDR